MVRTKIRSRLFWISLAYVAGFALALSLWLGTGGAAHGQGTRKDDIVFNSRGIPLAGASVRVCTMPAVGQPCTPVALIYSDSALTQAVANPTTTDGMGNYFFYAAPGQYELEFSGPGITTKQLPNVILPNDPSSPTFTGAISAFSLSLSGNLSVTGNTTVIGNLASGTLNLSNQSTPPGAANAGTVNLYTKTADKRLYYKDDTGTEIGPVGTGSGAQLNVANTFTAVQNFDADVENKGPNPWFSLARYGGYSSSTFTPPATTGTIAASSATLTLAAAQDFANGQGVVIYKAGVLPSVNLVTTPGTPTATPTNVLNGSTTYTYQVVAEDRQGGLTAASAAGSTTAGAATLGANTITLTQCARVSGVATYTSSANHNLQAGAQVNIAGFTGGVFDSCNGVKTIVATPTSTTFTANDGPLNNETNTTGSPTATAIACNILTFPSGSYSGNNTIHYWVYRNSALVGVAQGVDPWFMDCNYPAPNAPSYVPSTPPGAAQPGYLATTITAGGGTTTLTVANAAHTTATSQAVLHDNSPNLKAAIQAAYNANGGAVYIPSASFSYWVFNSTLDLTTGLSISGNPSVRVHVNSATVWLNQPWIPYGAMDFEGEPHVTTSFQYVQGGQIEGLAYPLFILPEFNGASAVHFSRLLLFAGQSQQTAILSDSGTDGGGVTGITLDDVSAGGQNGNGQPLVFKGGFDYFINRGDCGSGAASFTLNPCLRLTNASAAVTGSNIAQVPGRVKVKGLYFSGAAIGIDCLPNSFQISDTDYTFDTTIFESAVMPYLRFNCNGGFFNTVLLNDVVQADSLVGFGTPSIDSQNDNAVSGVSWTGGQVNAAQQPFFITANSGNGAILLNALFTNPGNAMYTAIGGGSVGTTGTVSAAGSGRVEFAMAQAASPSAAVSSGGAVPTGSRVYEIQWVDADGNDSPVSAGVTATVTTGNQTVTVTPPTAPAGAVGYIPYRDGAKVNFAGCGSLPIATAYVDTSSFTCGNSVAIPSAGSAIVGPNGLSGQQLRLTNNGNVLTTSFPNGLTASRTLGIPDVSGTLQITGYINSAYDNATRANGAIGSNWTVGQGGVNISSNTFVGTGGANNAVYWAANSFPPAQFSEVLLVTLNSTTDFPGVGVLMSGTGTSTQGYECIEDTANIYLQKIAGSGSNTTLTSAATSGAPGDIIRLEVTTAGALTCYKNGVSTLTITDTSFTSGAPGLFFYGNVATAKNWSGGNLHPLGQLDIEQDWTKAQHFVAGLAIGSEAVSASPRGEQNVFLPGALTSTWTGATWTADKGVTVTRVQVQTKTAPVTCSTNAIVRLTDGTTPVNLTISAAANDSGAISQNYAAGAALTVAVQTAAAGCGTSPADANVVVQYRMQ
jgi:hypothetical protein